jgi:hypothetical protein
MYIPVMVGGRNLGAPGLPGRLHVGGPGGIQVDGNRVQIGGVTVGSDSALMHPASHAHPLGSHYRSATAIDVAYAGELGGGATVVLQAVARHPRTGAALVVAAAAVTMTTAAVLISVLALPWLLIAIPGALATMLLGAAVMILAKAGRRARPGTLDPEVERRILDLAAANGGRLTVTLAARGLGMPLADTDAALGVLARSGHISVENDAATGVVVYVFPELEPGFGVDPMRGRRLP